MANTDDQSNTLSKWLGLRIYGYCIYNKLTDGSSFKVVQAYLLRIFHQHMEIDSISCCPYTMKDCSCNLKNDEEVLFYIFFYFERGDPPVKSVKCTTGGALVILGTQEGYSAECYDANGVYSVVPVEEAIEPSYYY
ncbi:hypothetical protein MFLAVUS_002618 [Mucor flavus]|uniref:Uncharacterized protein n=1 Tax=Mucor flavus TaxID=439312 RepID=A0ABP9YQR8_9FUNG